MDARHSFQVLFGGPKSPLHAQATDAIDPPYQVRTVDSIASITEALDDEVDCLVVTVTQDRASELELLELIREEWPELPIIPVIPEATTAFLRPLINAGISDVVYSEDGPDTAQTTVDRLRERVDDCYETSISDASETVLEISQSLMGAAPDEIDVEIEWGLKSVGRRLNADRCLVFEYNEETGYLQTTHSWYANEDEGTTSDTDVETIETASFPGFESIEQFNIHAIPEDAGEEIEFDVPDEFAGDLGGLMPSDDNDAGQHPYLEQRSLESFLAAPIVIDWELRGIIAVGQDHERPWPDRVRSQLQTLGELIGHTIDREHRRRELEEQNERLERFTSVVSHDLRNPLNVIAGSAALLEETGDPSCLEDIIASAERMEEMIEDLLTLARGGDELGERTRVSLQAVVDNAWQSVETSQATLATQSLGSVDADPGRLRQVFENLFRNAVEHNDGTEISVLVEGTDEGFAIEDDGCGIPAEMQTEIFEAGYTGGDGTGLGLSIVQTVLEAHDWEISVTDAESGGARFEVVTGPTVTHPEQSA